VKKIIIIGFEYIVIFYFLNKLEAMKNFCVIGSPIEHSKSPALHEAGFIDLEIDASFERVEVKPEALEAWVKNDLKNYQGVAVTIPHKETIREFLDVETEAADAIGAVNTVFFKDGQSVGTNTDGIGALKALGSVVPSLKDKRVLIMGAGGASRAIIFALARSGAEVMICNRTAEKARALAQEFSVGYIENLGEVTPESLDVIINATSVGLREWQSVVPEDFWRPRHVAFDIVYEPLETKFLADAQVAGADIVTGDQMLVFQALEQFRVWHEVELEAEVMAQAFF